MASILAADVCVVLPLKSLQLYVVDTGYMGHIVFDPVCFSVH